MASSCSTPTPTLRAFWSALSSACYDLTADEVKDWLQHIQARIPNNPNGIPTAASYAFATTGIDGSSSSSSLDAEIYDFVAMIIGHHPLPGARMERHALLAASFRVVVTHSRPIFCYYDEPHYLNRRQSPPPRPTKPKSTLALRKRKHLVSNYVARVLFPVQSSACK